MDVEALPAGPINDFFGIASMASGFENLAGLILYLGGLILGFYEVVIIEEKPVESRISILSYLLIFSFLEFRLSGVA